MLRDVKTDEREKMYNDAGCSWPWAVYRIPRCDEFFVL